MSKIKWDYDTFHVIPVSAKMVTDEETARYLEKVEEAKATMERLGLNRLVDKKVDKRPPTLRRKIS